MLITGMGLVTYVVHPMAPPWLAAPTGALDDVTRISGTGWQYFNVDIINKLQTGGQTASNPFAAMPSLHAASAALFTLFFWAGSRWSPRALLMLYPVSMGFTLVYTGEHYVIYVLAGWLVAVLAMTCWFGLGHRHPR